jgi:hypothetical protein
VSLSFILLIGRRFILPFILEVCELGVCSLSIRLFWGNGYGGMLRRGRLFGDRYWIKYIVVCRVVDALML